MNTSELKTKLAEEMSDLAPNRLDELLQMCDERAPAPSAVKTPRPRRIMPRIMAAAAVFVLLLGGILGYYVMDASRCVVMVDVNPSVSMEVNRLNRVKNVVPLNADAAALLEDMDLENMSLDRAVEALTSAMIDKEYLSDVQNAMLVSVENASAERAEALCKKVVSTVEETAQTNEFHTAVLYQRLSDDADIQAQAERLNVSAGKVALVDTMAAQMEDWAIERLSTLPIQDLLFLADKCGVEFKNASLFGTVSSSGYSSIDAAAAIALESAGSSGLSAADCTATLDSRDGELAYVVRFSDGRYTYRYTISAKSGAVLDSEQIAEGVGQSGSGGTVTPPQPPEEETPSLIDPMDALNRVLGLVNHVVGEVENPNVQTEWIGDTPVYHISFTLSGQEYNFYVDARTGDIVWR